MNKRVGLLLLAITLALACADRRMPTRHDAGVVSQAITQRALPDGTVEIGYSGRRLVVPGGMLAGRALAFVEDHRAEDRDLEHDFWKDSALALKRIRQDKDENGEGKKLHVVELPEIMDKTKSIEDEPLWDLVLTMGKLRDEEKRKLFECQAKLTRMAERAAK